MEKGSSHNLSMALRHILQQFMDSMNEHRQKNTDMVLPHDGYSQKLSWYFECDKCHYKAFYSQEMDAHRVICYSMVNHQDRGKFNQFQQNSEHISNGSAMMVEGDFDVTDAGPQNQNLSISLAMSGFDMDGQPTGGAGVDNGMTSPPARKTTAKKKRKRKMRAATQGVAINVADNVAEECGNMATQDAKGEPCEKPAIEMEQTAPKEEQPWEYEQIIVSADPDCPPQEPTSNSKRTRKVLGQLMRRETASIRDGGSASAMYEEHYRGGHNAPTLLTRQPQFSGLKVMQDEKPIRKNIPHKKDIVRNVSRFDHSRCNNKCALNVPPDTQDRLLQHFAQLSKTERHDYYSKTVITKAPNRNNKQYKGKKQASYAYYVSVDGRLVRVCKDFYVSTHGISAGPLDMYLNHSDKNTTRASSVHRPSSAAMTTSEPADVTNADDNNTSAAEDDVK